MKLINKVTKCLFIYLNAEENQTLQMVWNVLNSSHTKYKELRI